MSRLLSREEREAELQEIAARPLVGITTLVAILHQKQGAHLAVPPTPEEMIEAILAVEYPGE